MNTVPTAGKELRLLRLQDKISRRRLALFAGRSEERIVQIEKKLYVRADAVRRYLVALSGAVEYRSLISESKLPKRRPKKKAEVINGLSKPNHGA